MFTKTAKGGIQEVIAKDPKDAQQIALIREHLQHVAAQFRQGDFSSPAEIHGAEMPGLAELKKAKPGEMVRYQDVPQGGTIRYATKNASLVTAIHRWFDAQLSDHGADAREGHEGSHHHAMH